MPICSLKGQVGVDPGSRFATKLVARGASEARTAGLGLATIVGFWGVVLLLAKVRHSCDALLFLMHACLHG